MNMKEVNGYLDAIEAVLDAVPGLVDAEHVARLRRLRLLFVLLLQTKDDR